MLKIYDAKNIWEKKGKPPVLGIDKKGKISFSVEAVKLLKLVPGDKLAFAMDDADEGMIYFFKSKDGIPLKVAKVATTDNVRLCCYCRPLATKILEFLKLTKNKSFLVTTKTTKVLNNTAWFIQKNEQYARHVLS